ncbi:protein of unknown function [Burkholderia multivorans]
MTLPINDADSFFDDLQGKVDSVEEFNKPHPLSKDIAVASTKRFLADPLHRIRLRTQYPSWDREKYLRYCTRGKRMPKSEIMTVDFMLTLKIPGHPLRYHGVSGKPAAFVEDQKVIIRHGRESDALWKWECTHEVMTDETIPEIEFKNYRHLFAFMLHTEDIGTHALAAADFARALYATGTRGSLDRVLRLITKRFGWTLRFGYRLFGIAHFLGYLTWDHRYELSRDLPMMLSKEYS